MCCINIEVLEIAGRYLKDVMIAIASQSKDSDVARTEGEGPYDELLHYSYTPSPCESGMRYVMCMPIGL